MLLFPMQSIELFWNYFFVSSLFSIFTPSCYTQRIRHKNKPKLAIARKYEFLIELVPLVEWKWRAKKIEFNFWIQNEFQLHHFHLDSIKIYFTCEKKKPSCKWFWSKSFGSWANKCSIETKLFFFSFYSL